MNAPDESMTLSHADLAARLSALEERAVADREAIAKLEDQVAVDRDMIAHVLSESAAERSKVANLEVALISARRIGTAMGVLMMSRKVTDDEAFELLRKTSQAKGRKLRDIAEDVIMTGTIDYDERPVR